MADPHYYFRKENLAKHDLDVWNDTSKRHVGYVGLTYFLFGVAVWILDMVEISCVSVVAKMIGVEGGSIANELTSILTRVFVYPSISGLLIRRLLHATLDMYEKAFFRRAPMHLMSYLKKVDRIESVQY